MGHGITLFFNGAAYFTEVFPERVIRIGRALLKISTEVQLFAQRAPTSNRLSLTPFSFPDFVCEQNQVLDVLCKYKQATVVIRKSHITSFDEKIPEPRRAQR